MPQTFTLFDSYLKNTATISADTTVHPGTISMYSCGPTVYNFQSIGNMRAVWLPDTITRVAHLAGWKVNWVSNITDVGHLVGDGDQGKDKLEVGAKRENKKVEEVVQFYTQDFKQQTKALNFRLPTGMYNPRATEYVHEQMILALRLLKDNKAYVTDDGIYVDYTVLQQYFTQKSKHISDHLQEVLRQHAKQTAGSNTQFTGREIVDSHKKSSLDFAIWKFVDPNSLQKWKFEGFEEAQKLVNRIELDTRLSQWGTPGWHSECVCMISETVGNKLFSQTAEQSKKTTPEIDIHTGGEDHIAVHHANEIIQSEALDFTLSKHWVHNKFVMVDGGKMSKSLGNVYLVTGKKADTGFDSIQEQGFDPLAYRLMLMEHHYTEQLNFTWQKLKQSQARLENLKKDVAAIRFFAQHKPNQTSGEIIVSEKQKQVLLNYLLDNLNTPKFVEKFQEMVTETLVEINKNQTLNLRNLAAITFWETEFLELNLMPEIPAEVEEKAAKRAEAKAVKDWIAADSLRDELKADGWQVDDYAWGWGVWVVR